MNVFNCVKRRNAPAKARDVPGTRTKAAGFWKSLRRLPFREKVLYFRRVCVGKVARTCKLNPLKINSLPMKSMPEKLPGNRVFEQG